MDRPITDEDWQLVHQVIMSLQSPKPFQPNWLEELGEDWPAKARHARAVLLQAQQDGEPLPDHLWDVIDPIARAGFLRNTITGGLQYLETFCG